MGHEDKVQLSRLNLQSRLKDLMGRGDKKKESLEVRYDMREVYTEHGFPRAYEKRDVGRITRIGAAWQRKLLPEGICGHAGFDLELASNWYFVFRQTCFDVIQYLKTDAKVGDTLMIAPFRHTNGYGTSYTLNHIALYGKQSGYITLFVPRGKELARNVETIDACQRHDELFDQPRIAHRMLKDLYVGPKELLQKVKLKQTYTMEKHGFTNRHLWVNSFERCESELEEAEREAHEAAIREKLNSKDLHEFLSVRDERDHKRVYGVPSTQLYFDPALDPQKVYDERHPDEEGMPHGLYDRNLPGIDEPIGNEGVYRTTLPASPDELTLLDLIFFGLQSEEWCSSVMLDVLRELELATECPILVVADDVNFWDFDSRSRHPDTLKPLPANCLSLVHYLQKIVHNGLRNGYTVFTVSADIPRSKTPWAKQRLQSPHSGQKNFFVKKYNNHEFDNMLKHMLSLSMISKVASSRPGWRSDIICLTNRVPRAVNKVLTLL